MLKTSKIPKAPYGQKFSINSVHNKITDQEKESHNISDTDNVRSRSIFNTYVKRKSCIVIGGEVVISTVALSVGVSLILTRSAIAETLGIMLIIMGISGLAVGIVGGMGLLLVKKQHKDFKHTEGRRLIGD